jgi:putative membrane protein
MLKLAIRFIVMTGGVFAVAYFFSGIEISSARSAIMAAIILGVLNALVRPVFAFFTFPLKILTLGAFTFVLNGIMLWMASGVVEGFFIDGFMNAFLGALLISLLSAVTNEFIG